MVQEHNKPAATVWNEGGANYDFISFAVSDALTHAVQRLWPREGETVLDVATGTGWTARSVAALGAQVTAVDIADELIDAARSLSAHIEPPIDFKHADAEALPFDEGQFNAVISTFGVMFAGNHTKAAKELCRVCGSGGRIVLATWASGADSFVARMFGVIAKHGNRPPLASSPLDWGKSEYIEKLFGDSCELDVQEKVSTLYAPNGDLLWEKFVSGFGPVKLLAGRLSSEELTAFKDEFVALHEEYREGDHLRIERKYLLTEAVRK